MDKKKAGICLIILFVLALGLRLYFAFTIPHFTHESYFHLRQVESIRESGLPLFDDPLSYGGRETFFLPFFDYAVSIFTLVGPLDIVAKLIPNILMSSLIFIVYLISFHITKNRTASLFSSFIVGFVPIIFTPTSFTVQSLFLPLIFLCIYAFLKNAQKKYLSIYITTFVILCLTSAATFFLLMGFGIYVLLSYTEGKKIDRVETELILFSLFFYLWSQFLFFKESLVKNGITFIWHNVPPTILTQYFPQVSIGQALVLVSIIPFLAGVFVVYKSLFATKKKGLFLLISITVATGILAWFRLIEFTTTLAFLSIILSILFASFYVQIKKYLIDIKNIKIQRYFSPIIVLILVATMVYPTVLAVQQQNTPTSQEMDGFHWIKENIQEDATILTTLEEGHLVAYESKKMNLMDSNFALVEDVEQRAQAMQAVYTTSFETIAVQALAKYDIKYIVFTRVAAEKYGHEEFGFISHECFKPLFSNDHFRIHQAICEIERME